MIYAETSRRPLKYLSRHRLKIDKDIACGGGNSSMAKCKVLCVFCSFL